MTLSAKRIYRINRKNHTETLTYKTCMDCVINGKYLPLNGIVISAKPEFIMDRNDKPFWCATCGNKIT